MENIREEQIEALKAANEYSARLINGIENVSAELSGKRLPDTDQYLNEIINGINWIIEIVNRTSDVLNENGAVIDKENINAVIMELGDALTKKDDQLIASALKGGVLDFVKMIQKLTAEY